MNGFGGSSGHKPTIEELRLAWEKGLWPIAVKAETGRQLVVLKDGRGRYHCHRYMESLGDVSVDARDIGPDDAIRWLTNPHALRQEEIGE